MRVGDILVYVGNSNKYYTKNKHYVIFRIVENCTPIAGYIRDNEGDQVYFTENQAENEYWKYLKTLRKNKLNKIIYNEILLQNICE